jgi:RNA polymerase sigma-70 factor (ECF subfamily)
VYSDEDMVLVRQFKNGDDKAFDRLYEKYRIPVYSICYRYTRNEADARDLIQEIFIKVYNNIKKFNERSKFFTWLYRITINTCISFVRKNSSSRPIHTSISTSMSLDKRVRMKIAIDNALAQLPARQRCAFVLHHYEGYTFEETGKIMKISTGAAKANHFQAIRKLRKFLKDWI